MNTIQRGGNYGWDCREGAHDFEPAGCPASGLIDPVAEYGRTLGESITGGYVYRGSQPSSLVGRYLFADFDSGRIWAWIPNPSNPSSRAPTQLLQTTLNISSFGQGNDGELYVTDYVGGTLQRINFQPGSGGGTAPATLSATGCVNPSNATQPASGLIPYSINAPFWSDNASKQRWIGLPNGPSIAVGANDDWDFPNGTVLMKNFSVGTRLIETRLLMRHPDGNWGGFTYEWNAQQTDANLVQGGAVRDIGGGQQWIFPSEAQCLQCHTSAAGRALGPETAQLNRDFTLSADRPHREPVADAERDRPVRASDRRSAGAAHDAGPGGRRARRSPTARVPIYTRTARSVIAPADRRRSTWICATRRPSPRRTRAT